MSMLLVLLSVAGFIGLRRPRFDLISFSLILVMVLVLVVVQHEQALFGEIQVK